jgi:hypothetical protein
MKIRYAEIQLLAAGLVLTLIACRGHGRDLIKAKIDSRGTLSFFHTNSGRPGILREFSISRIVDHEPMCVVTLRSSSAPGISSWRYGESLGDSYVVDGCGNLPAGVYRIEFYADNTFGACDVCVGSDGNMFVGNSKCKNGTCEQK